MSNSETHDEANGVISSIPNERFQRYDFDIEVTFKHRIVFTKNAFSPDNDAIIDILREGSGRRVIVFVEERVSESWPQLVAEISERFAGLKEFIFEGVHTLIGGEAAKDEDKLVRHVWQMLDDGHIDRHSYALVVGGGAFLDAVGYAAATAHRGVRMVRFPTTTLSQDDSGVGVKCAVNFFQKKNWVGAFSVPFAVVNDFRYLYSQSDDVCRSGLAEAVKVSLVKDRDFFNWIEANVESLCALEPATLETCVTRSALHHVRHIATSGDAFEMGNSRPLDYGHWSAHKIESLTKNQVGHAHAVAIGLALDSLYASRIGLLDPSCADRVIAVLDRLRMPTYHPALDWINESTHRRLVFDGINEFREHLGGELTVLLLRDIGVGVDIHELDESIIGSCIDELRDRK